MAEEPPPKKTKTSEPLAVEVCCGHAGLSEALHKRGWDVRAVDWVGNEHTPRVPVLEMDLTDQKQSARLLRLVKRARYVT